MLVIKRWQRRYWRRCGGWLLQSLPGSKTRYCLLRAPLPVLPILPLLPLLRRLRRLLPRPLRLLLLLFFCTTCRCSRQGWLTSCGVGQLWSTTRLLVSCRGLPVYGLGFRWANHRVSMYAKHVVCFWVRLARYAAVPV